MFFDQPQDTRISATAVNGAAVSVPVRVSVPEHCRRTLGGAQFKQLFCAKAAFSTTELIFAARRTSGSLLKRRIARAARFHTVR
jgi:hypothetical protein